MATPTLLGGLFDRPLTRTAMPVDVSGGVSQAIPSSTKTLDLGLGCPDGTIMDIFGDCVDSGSGLTGDTGSGSSGSSGSPVITINEPAAPPETDLITNNINITDTGIQQVSQAVQDAITGSVQDVTDAQQAADKAIADQLAQESQAIADGIQVALTNVANTLQVSSQTIAAGVTAQVATTAGSIATLITNVTNFINPILKTISTSIDAVNAEVKAVNDTLITPIVTLYNTTVGTISALTVAIENDLKTGISGLLQIPSQLAGALGSIDATLDRTVQQLGTTNLTTAKTSIDYAGEALPNPFGAAMSAALGGSVLANTIKTTFSQNVQLNPENFQQVSNEAVSAIGTLLADMLKILMGSSLPSVNSLHADWTSVGSVFVGLLDGLVGLLVLITSIGAVAEPLLDAASEQARILVPTKKLDAQTAITALTRKLITSDAALAEIATSGLDPTRAQTLIDLNVFLADVNTALDWWYRGIISGDDLNANIAANGLTENDGVAVIAASIRLPEITDLQRWLNYGIINQDQFTSNAKILRYDDDQITAILDTYLIPETPELLNQIDGTLNASSIGWFNTSSKLPIPDRTVIAGRKAGYSPALQQFLWLSHWRIPPVETFIQNYFRGIRTLTEVQARMQMDNIPSELWDDIIQANRPLIPFRSLATYVKDGLMTVQQATAQLTAHGFDLPSVELLSKAFVPPGGSTTAVAATTVHTLSISNARTLWGDGALSDSEYTTILEAHGYTANMAALQMQADKITEHIKTQKQTIADYTAQVEAGVISLDDAITQLTQQGFTSAQVSQFQIKVTKALKVSSKHPSLSELLAFVKAGYITVSDYTSELVAQGWADPWLTAFTKTAQSDAPTSLVTPTGS